MKYRTKEFKLATFDVYILQKKVLCFWVNVGSVDTKAKLDEYIAQQKLDEFNATRHP